MRLLFVVQRYGAEVAGGSETFCRSFATRLAGRGHVVEVLTSCATSYLDWADVYAPGTETLDGVRVHRLPVARTRQDHSLSSHAGRASSKRCTAQTSARHAERVLEKPHQG